MCEPLTLAALAVGAAGAGANAYGQAKQAKAQKQEDASWTQRQEQNRLLEMQRQEEQRKRAEAAQQGAVKDLTATKQGARQDAEEARLISEMGADNSGVVAPLSVADKNLTTGNETAGEVYKTDLARGIADASASAKERLRALAAVSSFGGSEGGLGTVNPLIQQRAGTEIDIANNKRRGSLNAFNIEQAVDPVDLGPYSNMWADAAQSFSGVGGAMAGKDLAGGSTSSVFNGAVKPKPVPAGMKVDPLTGRLF